MRNCMKKFGLFVIALTVISMLGATINAEAAVKWAFSTSDGKKKASVNATITMEKGEYQDMNLYRNGKQIKEKDATYTVKWYSSDKNVVYVDKASGKMKADKYGKMTKDTGKAKITAVIKNKKTGSTTKKSFTVNVKGNPMPTATPTPAMKETPASAFEYEIINGNEVEIIGLLDDSLYEIYIPETIGGYPVTSIRYCYGYNLMNVEIPATVSRISAYAFSVTPWFERLQQENQYLIFGDGVLCWVSPDVEGAFTIPKNVKYIGGRAFYENDKLTSVRIPDSVTGIGEQAFQYCSNLASVTIPESVTSVGRDAFEGTPWMEQQTDEKTLLVVGDGVLIWVAKDAEGTVAVPSNVKYIADDAFSGCESLVSVKIPNGVKCIGKSAFYGCRNLSDIKLPEGVERINRYAFGYCESLANIEIPSSVKHISGQAFEGTLWLEQQKKDNTLLILGDGILYWASANIEGEFVIPDGATSIGDEAFEYNRNLTKVVLPSGVVRIGSEAFNGCSSLADIIMPDGLKYIGERAFAGCDSLTDIVIPEGVKRIAGAVFSGCEELKTVKLPSGLTDIGNWAFSSCSNLKKVELPLGVSGIGQYAFFGCKALTKITIRSGVRLIGESAFSNCTSLKNIEIPSGVESIEMNAFYNTPWLDNLKKTSDFIVLGNRVLYWVSPENKGTFKVPEGVTYIASEAFADCNKVTGVNLPNGVEIVGHKAFFNCTALKKLELPSGVKVIGDRAFYNCEKLASVNVDKVSYIGSGAFINCKSLIKIELPKGMVRIYGYVMSLDGCDDYSGMFAGCSKLESVVIPEGVLEIGAYAFENCTNLKSISLPESLLEIGVRAFDNCTSLESIFIPKNVSYFGSNSFYKQMSDCENLKEIVVDVQNEHYESVDGVLFSKDNVTLLSVPDAYQSDVYTIPNGTQYISSGAFKNCNNIVSISIPESVKEIGDKAFDQCERLSKITLTGDNKVYFCENGVLYERLFFRDVCYGVELKRVFGANVTELYIPEYVTNFSGGALNNCKNLKTFFVSETNEEYVVVDGVLYSKDKRSIIAVAPKHESLRIPKDVYFDWECELSMCTNLEVVVFEEGTTELLDEIRSIPNLKSLYIPATVEQISDYWSSDLTDVTIHAPSGTEAEAWAKRNGLEFVEE